MFRLIKNIDNRLIKNNPEIWLSRIHHFLPGTFILLIISASAGYLLPLTYNIIPLIITGCLVFLCLFVWLLRIQFLYSNENFNTKQLNRIFLLNLVTITFFILTAVASSYILAARVNALLEKNDFENDTEKIRIAMIKTEWIDAVQDSSFDVNRGRYDLPEKFKNIADSLFNNEFVKNNISDIRLSFNRNVITGDSAIAVKDSFGTPPVDTNFTRLDTTAFIDTTTSLQGDSSRPAGTNNTGPTLGQAYPFLLILKTFSPGGVRKFKQSVHGILRKYDFTVYKGDSTIGSVNSYFKTLNRESLNLYKSKKMYYDPVPIITFLVLVISFLTQLSFLVMMKRQVLAVGGAFLAVVAICLGILSGIQYNLSGTILVLGLMFSVFVIFLFATGAIIYFELPVLFFIYFFVQSLATAFLNGKVFAAVIMYIMLFLLANYQFIRVFEVLIKKPRK